MLCKPKSMEILPQFIGGANFDVIIVNEDRDLCIIVHYSSLSKYMKICLTESTVQIWRESESSTFGRFTLKQNFRNPDPNRVYNKVDNSHRVGLF